MLKVVCHLCDKKLTYNGLTTSNHNDHLQTHQKQSVIALGKQETIGKLTCSALMNHPCLEACSRDITELLTWWYYTDFCSLSIVHNKNVFTLSSMSVE